ncbi:septum site-determining protein Ssd [Allostreptomyces psammosilenae]|uniref:Secretion/DNA translocation related CpaE-like protein n=1 Tax=Allostreptomyces psammosilenae TaxID=1892865 RepID=A0A852ZY11_9ACTN|nr:septum site-determining protein Ssd [Allostreptomyces psammosilenae]NYI05614.1 secretion/DNA translocation related CpaE-like protein [Allostreptomyces psammosilenae]
MGNDLLNPSADRDAPAQPGPLLVTGDDRLLDDLLRLCAVAGVEPQKICGATDPPTPGLWQSAPLILVGCDAVPWVEGAARREGVLLIGRDLDDAQVWRNAMAVGADHVAFLPEAEPWLVDRIADAVESQGTPAFTIGVVGGRGGAGASTLAAALATHAAEAGRPAMLLDADPLGGGLDLLLGAEQMPGLRWPDLAGAGGRVNATALAEALPRPRQSAELAVLSWDRSDVLTIPPAAMRAVLGASRRRGGLVVIDLPRRFDEAAVEALGQCDLVLLVVPREIRAVAAAARIAAAATMLLRDVRVVARGPAPSGLTPAEVAGSLALPLAGELDPEPGLGPRLESGRFPAGGTGPLARFCRTFLTALAPTLGPAPDGGAA